MAEWSSSQAHKALVAELAAARNRAGLTQRDVACKLGKQPSYVAKIERVARNLSVFEFVDLCRAIGVDPATVLAVLSDPAVPQR